MTIRRTESGRVDLADPVAVELLERLDDSPVLAPEVVRVALDLGWWELGLSLLAPSWVGHAYAEWHRELVSWAMGLEPGTKPRPLVVCASRGSGKSSILSLALLLIACRRARSYGLYVSNTGRQTQDAIAGVAELLGSPVLSQAFPRVAEQYRTEQGQARDWTKHRIRTGSGFTLDGIGMDQSMRGARIGSTRPDLIVFDDIEDREDSPATTAKKKRQLTDALIPAGSSDAAVVLVQNMIHPPDSDGIMAEVVGGRADLLANAVVLGPIPMVENLELTERTPTDDDPRRYVITGGRPTWEGQRLEFAESLITEGGLSSFLRERQHEDAPADGGLFDPGHWGTSEGRLGPLSGLCRSWDLAFTEDAGDWTVGVLMALDAQNKTRVLDVIRVRHDAATVLDLIEATADADSHRFKKRVPVVIEEMPAAGKGFRSTIEQRLAGRRLHFVRPTSGKEDRALAYATEQQSGRVLLHRTDDDGPMFADFVREHASFPNGRHDDQVDAASQGFDWLHAKRKRPGRIGRGASSVTSGY